MIRDRGSANEEWKRNQINSICYSRIESGEEEEYWEQFAEDYYRNRTSGPHYQDVLGLIIKAISKGCDLLEIGPGPGVFTLPLSSHAGKITAIEPSPSVVAILERMVAGLGNVEIINDNWEKWENPEEKPYDFVLAAGVLYAFYDLESALRKMILNARQKVVIVTIKDEQPFAPEVAAAFNFPRPRPHSPPSELIFDVLRDITTSFSCQRITGKQVYEYQNLSRLLDSWKHCFTFSPEMLPKLKLFLKGKGYLQEGNHIVRIPRMFVSTIIEVEV